MSKVIPDCIGFASLRFIIGLENSRHPLSQSDTKLKPMMTTWSLAFSRAKRRLRAFTLSSHWLFVIFTFVLISSVITLVLVYDTQLKSALLFTFIFSVLRPVKAVLSAAL